jgi:hypothetical protein
MPDMTGIETAQQMSAADPTVPLILFTILEIEGIKRSPKGRDSCGSAQVRLGTSSPISNASPTKQIDTALQIKAQLPYYCPLRSSVRWRTFSL